MSTPIIVMLVILVVLIAAFVALYFVLKKAEAKRAEQQAQVEAMAQQVSMLIIDKKMMKFKDAGFPEQMLSGVNWFQKSAKVPVVKAKAGPQVMNFICDAEIFDQVPVKKEVKATVSGLYITKVKGLHGNTAPVEQKKKGLRAWLTSWALKKRKELESEQK